MNILILNWRDIKNPSGGGAEVLTQEMGKRWVKSGHQVRQFSALFPGAKKEEVIDGVKMIRRGAWWTVHIYAFFYYLKQRQSVDVIIDEVHWFPFFSAVYAPKKTIALTCEVASKLLFRIFPYPIALAFLLLENIYLYLYKDVPTMTISPSTKRDLILSGHKQESIVVLPMGITFPKNVRMLQKEKKITLISVGRLNKQKGTLDVLDAFSRIMVSYPKSALWLMGSGENNFLQLVDRKVSDLNIKDAVKILGYVGEEEKFARLSRAHVLISASMQEGWGLTIPEAGLMNTPSVVYNIAGFRDTIVQQKTGILTKNNPKDLAKETISLLKNKQKYNAMQTASLKHARFYSWDKTASTSIEFIKKVLRV